MTAQGAAVPAAAAPQDSPRAVLAWCAANRSTASPQLLKIATALANDSRMDRAWRDLSRLGLRPVEDVLLWHVAHAWMQAAQELERPPAAEERAKIERVIRLACELGVAIEEAPLLKGQRNANDASALLLGPSPPPLLWMGWGDPPAPARRQGEFTLSLREAVRSVERRARWDLFQLRNRALTRRRGKETPPMVSAFVRYLAYGFRQVTGGNQAATIARMVTALFEDSPQTARSIGKILKDGPAESSP